MLLVPVLNFHTSQLVLFRPYIHQCLEERNIAFSQMKKFCILQGSAVTFSSGVVGKG